ncbi:MAG: hypothetical protein AAGE52_03405 [Myxococcota bacterium]
MDRLLVTVAALLAACGSQTQVIVEVDADTTVQTRATQLRITISGEDGVENTADRCLGEADGCLGVPFRIALAPKGNNPDRGWQVDLIALEGTTPFVMRTVRGRYVRGETRIVTVRLEEPCVDVRCGDGETCIGGICECADEDDCTVDGGLDTGVDGGVADACPDCGECEVCDGSRCVPADEGIECGGGLCRLGVCCTGCWDGTRCVPVEETDPTACGERGAECETCPCGSDRCAEGSCRPRLVAERVEAGTAHTCAYFPGAERMRVRCWGDNSVGQVGTTTDSDLSSVPVLVDGQNNSESGVFAAGNSSCFLREGGTLSCWGAEFGGTASGSTLRDIGSGFSAPTLGPDHLCATRGGQLQCWGANTVSPPSDPTPNIDFRLGYSGRGSATPVDVTGVVGVPSAATSTGRAIAAGGRHTCVLIDGQMRCWGSSCCGQTGHPVGTPDSSTPMTVEGGPWDDLAAGGFFTCGVRDGVVECFGGNIHGQVGRDPSADSEVRNDVGLTNVSVLELGTSHACAVADEELHCWGRNTEAQCGADSGIPRIATPRLVTGFDAVVTDLGLGSSHSCAVSATGRVYCWGLNDRGQLGVGETCDGAECGEPSPQLICF